MRTTIGAALPFRSGLTSVLALTCILICKGFSGGGADLQPTSAHISASSVATADLRNSGCIDFPRITFDWLDPAFSGVRVGLHKPWRTHHQTGGESLNLHL